MMLCNKKPRGEWDLGVDIRLWCLYLHFLKLLSPEGWLHPQVDSKVAVAAQLSTMSRGRGTFSSPKLFPKVLSADISILSSTGSMPTPRKGKGCPSST